MEQNVKLTVQEKKTNETKPQHKTTKACNWEASATTENMVKHDNREGKNKGHETRSLRWIGLLAHNL